MKITLSSGNKRQSVTVGADRPSLKDAARDIKNFLFPTNASFHQSKRRGERAMQGAYA